MDLIDLYHRRGVSLVRARLAGTDAARRGYGRVAKLYADRIEQSRDAAAAESTELMPVL